LSAIQAVAPSFNVELSVVGVRDTSEIERSVTAFARSSNGGMIVMPSTSAVVHRNLITMLAARHGLPAVYSFRYFVTAGGLLSYAANSIDMYRRGERAAVMLTLMQTAKLNQVDPQAWLDDVLARIADHKITDLGAW
jgi:putative ABC transport system substrate-binding protein